MRIEGVGRAGDLGKGEGQADFGAKLDKTVVDRLQPPVAAELPFHVLGPVEPALRNGRVELVGTPADDDGL